MNKGTYYFPRNRTYQSSVTGSSGGGTTGYGPFTFKTIIDIDMSLGDYYITESAFYHVRTSDITYSVIFPDPTPMEGQLIWVWYDGSGVDLYFSGTYSPYATNGSQLVNLKNGYKIECFSINNKWYYKVYT